MGKGVQNWIFLITFIAILALLPSVSANFACGEVLSLSDVSPSWFEVTLHYTEDSTKQTLCEVSPEENKYCCDPQEIESISWQVGKELTAFISQDGYSAAPVETTISGEGFDLFPTLFLEKNLEIHSPNQSLFFDTSLVFVNISLSGQYDSMRYELNSSSSFQESEICSNCTTSAFYLENLSLGSYVLEIFANSSSQEISEVRGFSIIDSLGLEREIECRRCRGKYVFANSNVSLTISLDSSQELEGTLVDYFPVDWQFLDGEGTVSSFSETHNVISWNVSGTNIEKTYYLQSPNTIFPKKYEFQSGFNDYLDVVDELVLYRFHRFFPLQRAIKRGYGKFFTSVNYSSISPENPLVLSMEDRFLQQIAIFPNEEVNDVKAYVYTKAPVRMQRARYHFILESTLSDSQVDEVMISFRELSRRGDATLFHYNISSNAWDTLQTNKTGEDEEYNYFISYAEKEGIFAIQSPRR